MSVIKFMFVIIILPVSLWMLFTAISLPSDGEYDSNSHKLFELINQERKELNIPLLIWDKELAKLATEHSQYMAITGDYEHSNFPFAYAENIMIGDDPNEVYTAWVESRGHYEIMTDQRLRYGGIGMFMKITTLTFGDYKITINVENPRSTFIAK